MGRAPWGLILPLLLVLVLCGMAMHVTGADNACPTEIDWLGRCSATPATEKEVVEK